MLCWIAFRRAAVSMKAFLLSMPVTMFDALGTVSAHPYAVAVSPVVCFSSKKSGWYLTLQHTHTH